MPSQIARGRFLRQLASNGLSEIVQKVSRIAVIVVVARMMEAEAIGLAAAAIAAGDILKALTENGVVQRVIAARDADLEDVALTARRLFWGWCLGLFALQVLLAAGIWAWTGDTVVPALIAVLALEYLLMPAGLVQCALAMREDRLTGVAAIAGAQIVVSNLLCAALALIWPVPMALVLPRVLAAPIWLFGMRRLRPWRPAPAAKATSVAPFVRFGGFVLGSELVRTARMQADKLLIGALLGAEALGVYFFAFNAGLGLASSFSVAFARVVFPRICAATDRGVAAGEATRLAVWVAAPIVMLQAALAPIYVPLLFGERWAHIADVVAILCLAAIPTLIWSGTAQWLRAEDRPETELAVTAALTVALLLSTYLLAPYGLTAIAWGYLAVSTLVQLGASVPLMRHSFTLREA